MANAYRWGDVPPESAQRLKARREAREQQAFSREIDARLSGCGGLAPSSPAKCGACACVKFVESDEPIRVCLQGVGCTTLKSGCEPSPEPAVPTEKLSDQGPLGGSL